MIAFHYPPCHGSSGLQRTLAFSRYLSQFGWDPLVLTVSPRAYENTSQSLLGSVPCNVPVRRVFALDTARHLSLWGRYPAFLAVPDRWVSWQFAAKLSAMTLIRKYRPNAIWSTYPIATAHMIGASVARQSRLPWVADMRDPMVEFDPYTGLHFPEDEAVRQSRLKIERDVIRLATKVVFCTEGARSICMDRYAIKRSDNFAIIPNGYDDAAFRQAETRARNAAKEKSGFVLLHSGIVYPGSDRGPEALFEALRGLNAAGALPTGFRLVLRAAGHKEYLENLVTSFSLDDLVQLAPSVTYQEALDEMLNSDALLVIQGPSSNPAIPAKVYEYFRARKPILGLLHPEGDTAALLRSLDAGVVAPLDDPLQISEALKELLRSDTSGRSLTISDDELPRFSRENQTGDLARLLHSL